MLSMPAKSLLLLGERGSRQVFRINIESSLLLNDCLAIMHFTRMNEFSRDC